MVKQCSNCKYIRKYTYYSSLEDFGNLWHAITLKEVFRQCHCKWHYAKIKSALYIGARACEGMSPGSFYKLDL